MKLFPTRRFWLGSTLLHAAVMGGTHAVSVQVNPAYNLGGKASWRPNRKETIMKLILTHPLRDCWLRLKLLRPAALPSEVRKQPQPPSRPKSHRTTAFFELP